MSGTLLFRRMPPTDWIQSAIHSEFTGHGWGRVGIVVDDENPDAVNVIVALPDQQNRAGATAVSKFAVDATTMAGRDEIERQIRKAAKKAAHSLGRQIAAEKARWN